jgi:UPF0755 protein
MKRLLIGFGLVVLAAYGVTQWYRATHRPPPVPVREEIILTLIEGRTIDDEGLLLATHGVTSTAFVDLAGRSQDRAAFDTRLRLDYPFLMDAPRQASLEGYLFPDTYRVWRDALPESLVRKQLDRFAEQTASLDADRKAQRLSWHDLVTLASIVEDEVASAEDRRIVAGIFLKRLSIGMALQSDATLNYVVKEGRSRANAKDLRLDSPYNTYRVRGLPPGPIGNPGFSALAAVVHPVKTPYLYFLTTKEGEVLYASSFEGHKRNRIKAYGY